MGKEVSRGGSGKWGKAITCSAADSTCGLKNEGGVQEEENAGKERGNNSHIPLHAETMHL